MRNVLLLLLCINSSAYADGFLERLSNLGGVKQATFLPVDEAFGLEVEVRDAHTLQANFRVTPGYYLYRDKVSFAIQKIAGQKIAGEKNNASSGIKITSVSLPKGDMKLDPNFGDTEVFHQSFQAVIALYRADNATAQSISLDAVYQGCSEQGLCYPPTTKTLRVNLPDVKTGQAKNAQPKIGDTASTVMSDATPSPLAKPSEGSRIAKLFKDGNFWLIIAFFFGAGLLLSLTPCMFPMIPILSGIIVGRGHHITHTHAFLLSLAYVLGMAITYAGAGVAAGYSGQLISSALQTPWVLGSFAVVFVLLSLSMFGFYELQLPSALQSKLTNTSNTLHGGHLSGVFVMGALSAIIMGPCVAAPLAGALLYISQTHDAVLGGVALFTLAMGMGMPLLLIGTSAGVWLPKAGAWMEAVKRFFGVMLLALAIWIIQPLLPMGVQMLLWAVLLIVSAIYLRALDAVLHNATGWHKLHKGIGLLVLLLGVAYLIGALSGARDILRPLGNLGQADTQLSATLKFSRVKDSAELDQRLAQAHRQGQMVMLDFYADWCISCKEMERFTFSDPTVQAKLKPVLLLQADVTANSEADQALLKRFGLYGPPGILFFDAQGNERTELRVVGFESAAQFLSTLQAIGL